MESDSDNSDVNVMEGNASVQLYMPVNQDGDDSAGDSVWQNVTLEPPHPSSRVEAGASYIPLHCIPEQQMHGRPWHVFSDSSDSSDTETPLVNFGRVVVHAPSTRSAGSINKSDKYPVSNDGDYLCLEGIKPAADCRLGRDFGQEVADVDIHGSDMVYQS